MLFGNSKLIPIEYQYKFNTIETKALDLMRTYEKMRRKYSNDPSYILFSRKNDPRESRFFESFKKLILQSEKKNTEIPHPEIFIKSQFEIIKSEYRKDEIYCPPQYLFSSYAWKRYKRYINDLRMEKNIKINNNKKTKSNKINIIRDIKETHTFIEKFCINNYGEQNIDYKKFFSDNKTWIYILNRRISPYILSVSKTFQSINIPKEITKEISNNFSIYKKEILSDQEILNIAKNLFKDEINEK